MTAEFEPEQMPIVAGETLTPLDGALHRIVTPALALLSQFDPIVLVAVIVPPA